MKYSKEKIEILSRYLNFHKEKTELNTDYYMRLKLYGNPLILAKDLDEQTFKEFIQIAIKEIREDNHNSYIDDLRIRKNYDIFIYEKEYSKQELLWIEELVQQKPELIELHPYISKSLKKTLVINKKNITSVHFIKDEDFIRYNLSVCAYFIFTLDKPTKKEFDLVIKNICSNKLANGLNPHLYDFMLDVLDIINGAKKISTNVFIFKSSYIYVRWDKETRLLLKKSLDKYFTKDCVEFLSQEGCFKYAPASFSAPSTVHKLIKYILNRFPDYRKEVSDFDFISFLSYDFKYGFISDYKFTFDRADVLPLKAKIKLYNLLEKSKIDLPKLFANHSFYKGPLEKQLERIRRELHKPILNRIFSKKLNSKEIIDSLKILVGLHYEFNAKAIKEILSMIDKSHINDAVTLMA